MAAALERTATLDPSSSSPGPRVRVLAFSDLHGFVPKVPDRMFADGAVHLVVGAGDYETEHNRCDSGADDFYRALRAEFLDRFPAHVPKVLVGGNHDRALATWADLARSGEAETLGWFECDDLDEAQKKLFAGGRLLEDAALQARWTQRAAGIRAELARCPGLRFAHDEVVDVALPKGVLLGSAAPRTLRVLASGVSPGPEYRFPNAFPAFRVAPGQLGSWAESFGLFEGGNSNGCSARASYGVDVALTHGGPLHPELPAEESLTRVDWSEGGSTETGMRALGDALWGERARAKERRLRADPALTADVRSPTLAIFGHIHGHAGRVVRAPGVGGIGPLLANVGMHSLPGAGAAREGEAKGEDDAASLGGASPSENFDEWRYVMVLDGRWRAATPTEAAGWHWQDVTDEALREDPVDSESPEDQDEKAAAASQPGVDADADADEVSRTTAPAEEDADARRELSGDSTPLSRTRTLSPASVAKAPSPKRRKPS